MKPVAVVLDFVDPERADGGRAAFDGWHGSMKPEDRCRKRRDESEGGMDVDKRPRRDEQRKGCCQQKRRQPFDATQLGGARGVPGGVDHEGGREGHDGSIARVAAILA